MRGGVQPVRKTSSTPDGSSFKMHPAVRVLPWTTRTAEGGAAQGLPCLIGKQA